MFRNYLKITLRNLRSSKLYSAINLLGLAIGLTATILVGLFVLDEIGYDRHYADADRIYRVSREFPPQNISLATNSPQVAPLLAADFPEIEYAARIFGGKVLLSSEDAAFYEANVRFADNEVFDIFALDWINGDPAQALTRPFTIVLTESTAMKYFGSVDVLGQSMTLENAVPLEVTGVIRDLPHNTHLDIGVVVSLSSVGQMLGPEFFEDWGSNNFYTYIKLQPGVAIETVATRFPDFLRRHQAENAEEFTSMTAFPLRDIHLYSGRQNEMKPPGSIGTVYAFTAAALFILLIACCNFMNLSTARSTRRGREVGVRKSLGATRSQLAWQFVGESLLLSLLAMMLALVMAELLLPTFNALIGKELHMAGDLRTFAALVGLVITVGIVAGSYPAFFLSAFKPVQVLRSLLATGGGAALRNTLVVLQFTIAIVLVVATLVVGLQLRYARDIETGFNKEQVVVLTGSPTAGLGPQWETLRERLASHPGVLSVTASAQTPLEINTNAAAVRPEGADQSESRPLPFMRVDYDFFATYEIPLLAGRAFSEEFQADRLVNGGDGAGLVLNRLAAERFGWTPEEALGKGLRVFQNGAGTNGIVIGVVENSYFESVRAELKPMLFFMPEYITSGEALMPKASIRLAGANLQEALAHIDATWSEFMPDFPLSRAFLDDQFAALFQAETRQGDVFQYFALLGIVVACLGLYGLASYNAERRTKEIGVRKVMGGSVWSIVLLLTNDFSKLVLIANVIAWPVAYAAMDRWLQNFAYRIDLTPVVFIGSGLIALCIAWVTVGSTAAKAASAKPVLALRYE